MAKYRYTVQADTTQARKSTQDLVSLFSELNKLEAQFKRSGSVNMNSQIDAIKSYQQINSEVTKLSRNMDRMQNSRHFAGETKDFQAFRSSLKEAQSDLASAAARINSISFAQAKSTQSQRDYEKAVNRSGNSLSDNEKMLRQIAREQSNINALGRHQRDITSRATSTGAMSYNDYQKYQRNNALGQNIGGKIAGTDSNILTYQARQRNIERENPQLMGADGTYDKKKLMQNNLEYKQLDELITAQKKYKDALERTQYDLDNSKKAVNQANPSIGFERGSFGDIIQNRIGATTSRIVGSTIASVKNYFKSGEQTNLNTGEQALDLGNLTGHRSSVSVRQQLQNMVNGNGLGYSTKEDLSFYQLAMERNGYSGNVKGQAMNTRMTQALEQAGRSTGIGTSAFEQLAQQAMDAGGILSDSDITRLSNVIAGENVRSGNSGNAQQNAQILTTAIQQLSQSSTLNATNIGNIGATQALLGRLGKEFQGQQGQQAISNLNAGFQSASTGQNQALMFMKIQSNPQKYGGMYGYLQAQKSLAKGLGDTSNIGMVRNYARKMGASGQSGQAAAAEMLETQFNLTPQKADKLSKDMINGNMSDSQISAEAKKIQSQGSSQNSSNLSSYNNDEYGTQNQINSGKERQQSQVTDSMQWWQKIRRGAYSTSPGVGMALDVGSTLATGAVSAATGNLLTAGVRNVFSNSRTLSNIGSKIGASKIGRLFGGGSGVAKGAEEAAGGAAGDAATVASDVGKGAEAVSTGGKLLSGLGKVGRFAGKAALPLAVAGDLIDVATAKNKARTAVKDTVGLGGSAAGAAIGTAILPGVGTVLGGLAGGWIGDQLGGAGYDAVSGANSKKATKAKNKSDSYLSSRKYEDDLHYERNNITKRNDSLETFSKLLKEEAEESGNKSLANKIAGTEPNSNAPSSPSARNKQVKTAANASKSDGKVKAVNVTMNVNGVQNPDTVANKVTEKLKTALANKTSDFAQEWTTV